MSTIATPAGQHREIAYKLAVLEASNAPVLIHPDDRKYGAMLVGGQGSGKTAAEFRMYLNDIRDPNATVLVFDPKSELAKLCLQFTPPDVGKDVWYLDLGKPGFGMSPLRMRSRSEDFATEATQIAENVVAALLDINEGQLFQSSKRFLYHAVIGALAYAAILKQRPRFEIIYNLLLPGEQKLREQVARFCGEIPDLEPTANFYGSELPGELSSSAANTAQKLDAPRNKISQIVGIPALRRFFNHPTDIKLSQIAERRDILIVDANMAAIGEDNAQACIHFIFRQLHTHMQRQVHRPESERGRVALICDEGHYLVSKNVIRQIATHRAAGLDVTIGLQFFSQLGAGEESASVTEEIRKGVLNLLQSRFLFRLGDPEDAETATRIAMAVYQTMISADPASRSTLRVTPEQVLNLPVYYCIASWIAAGSRAGSFVGKTYALPRLAAGQTGWTDHHMDGLKERGGKFITDLGKTLYHKELTAEELELAVIEWHARRDTVTNEALFDEAPVEPETRQRAAPPAPKPEGSTEDGAPSRRARRAKPAAAPAQAPDVSDEVPEDSVFYEAEREDVGSGAPAEEAEAGADQVIEADVVVAAEPVVQDDLGTPEAAERLREPEVVAPKYAADDPDFYPDGRIKADIAPEIDRPPLDRSAVRSVAGYKPTDQDRRTGRWKDEIPGTNVDEDQWHIKQLAMIDHINYVAELAGVKDAEVEEPSGMGEEMFAVLRLLDRVPLVMRDTLARAAFGDIAERTVRKRLGILRKAGYVYRAKVDMPNRATNLPSVYALTEAGMKVAQKATPPVIDPERNYRKTEGKGSKLAHDHHALHWVMRLQELLGPEVVTDNWRTPQVGAGAGFIKVPMVGNGQKRRKARFSDVVLPKGQMASGVSAFSDEKGFREIAPDVSIELELRNARRGKEGELRGLRFDLLLELDRTGRGSYNEQKFVNYDALLTAWWDLHPRYEKLMTRPIVVFVANSREHAESLATKADKVMTGRIGHMGTPPQDWYFPGREHIFFSVEEDLYHGSLRAFALDPLPPQIRKALGHGEAPRHRVISLLPPAMIGAHERKAKNEE